jgi:hypothetical protein
MIKFLRNNKPPKASAESFFLSKGYQMHNVARLSHLESLGLSLHRKKVIEFGAGIGDHTFYYLTKGCRMVTTDARSELVEFIQKRFDVTALVINAEKDLDKISKLEKCDIAHCYGILYHLQNPRPFLRSLNGLCDLLLLETCVSHDLRDDGEHVVSEDLGNPSQSVSGKGCRPTRKWIYNVLKETFPYVYFPKTQPNHPEFPLAWGIQTEDRAKLIRSVFIASQKDLGHNPNLTLSLPLNYEALKE